MGANKSSRFSGNLEFMFLPLLKFLHQAVVAGRGPNPLGFSIRYETGGAPTQSMPSSERDPFIYLYMPTYIKVIISSMSLNIANCLAKIPVSCSFYNVEIREILQK